MLFRRAELERIALGETTLAFRRWRRPTVKSGGRLRTAVGELAIEEVAEVDPAAVTDDEARRAGHADAATLRKALDGRPEGKVYRIAFRLAGPDARVALRAGDDLSPADLEALAATLDRMDRGAADGPWTRAILSSIARGTGSRAADLAAAHGMDTQAFKRRVRRLKELGLTESLEVGYRLSPRGVRLLRHLGG